jgi:isoleucyl-tRNA synthetase
LEAGILEYWKKNKIFEKSVEQRPENKKWTFLDGPPFITGNPHYGTLLSSLPKDLFGRYWTMKGYRVRRVWGWDGHGLPIENKVEGKLEIKRKRDIEEVVGVKKFIEECKKYVNEVSAEWEWYVDKIGRWVDFKNAYKTWDKDYMESVMWVFKQMYDKGYIYKGLRVSLFCPHCSTPISNFEVAMDADNHKDITEPADTYKYKIDKDTYILAWSTTPWNKIVTPALAVNPKLTYVKIKQGNELYILAKSTLKMLKNEPYEIIDEFKGKELVGMRFEPHYDYYKTNIKKSEKAFEIVADEFVTAEEGTGVVTIAVYGEEDLKVMLEQNIHMEMHVDEEGTINENVPKFGGMYYLKANKAVNEDLAERGLLYREDDYTHSVAHCWRCQTRLFYNPQNAWYVNVQNLKTKLKKTNESTNWFPKHFKTGRFLKSLESAPDWNISRSRYWGSPVPVWECECGERFVPGSIAELEIASGQKIIDLHKPEIDEVFVNCAKCGKKVKRVPEVLDSWIEAGSASFAERHFPFNKDYKLEDFFPPDFIAEYTGQIRAWFYVLHVIGTVIYDSPAFKNVVVEGVILGTDGRKMSKNYGNYPDPKELLQKYGGDALRLYLMGSPVMRGEDIIISEENYRNQVKGLMLILWNTYNFFVTYAQVDKWEPAKMANGKWQMANSQNVLDRWILSRLNGNIKNITESGYDKFNTPEVVGQAHIFISDLSSWYVRRIRDRIGPSAPDGKDKDNAYQTLWYILKEYCKVLAPLIPFITEEMYRNLTGEESVHLSDWPVVNKDLIDEKLENEMFYARQVVEFAHSKRKEAGIRVRQPLNSLTTISPVSFSAGTITLIQDEVNVKTVNVTIGKEVKFENLDTNITDSLKKEGQARDVVRMIQEERKNINTRSDEKIDVVLASWPEEFEDYIKRKALIKTLAKGETFRIIRNE